MNKSYKTIGEREQIVNELHRNARKRFPRRRVIQKGFNDTWQIDLVEMIPYAKENNGFKYLLTVIDIFSKYAYARALKTKSSENVVKAMKSIFKEAGTSKIPKNVHSDQGKEFFNQKFQNLMLENRINHYHTYSHLKASICERFNRTLKNLMWKQFSLQGTYKWIHIIQHLIKNYNEKIHSTIKMPPKNVTKANEQNLLRTIYNRSKIFRRGKYKVGDFVRINRYKGIFQKGYEPNWSTEIFKIAKVNITNPVTYTIEDYKQNEIFGGFYEQEITSAKSSNAYLVEKVLKKKNDKIFVKWLGFDKSHNSWINKKDLI